MGGIGKTELAIQYSLLHLQLNTYPGGICWIRCREENISSQIISFARTDLSLIIPEDLESEEQVRWCWKNWQEGNVLVVLDDVKNYKDIEEYLPPQPSQFKVLITTRLKFDLPNPINLKVLSESKALELLSKLIGSERVNQELKTAKEICEFLGYLPLALQLVGRYLKNYRKITLEPISLAEELANLKIKKLEDPALKAPTNQSSQIKNIELGVKAAFNLSWDRLSNTAQELGCLLSLFALTPIPPRLVEDISKKQEIKESNFLISKILQKIQLFKQQSTKIKKEDKYEDKIRNAILELENLHLLEIKDEYKFHQLIQEFFRIKQQTLPIKDEQKSKICKVISTIAGEIPQVTTLSDIKYFNSFIPHIIDNDAANGGPLWTIFVKSLRKNISH